MTKRKEKKGAICCPYCDEKIEEASFPFCQVCKVTIFYCPKCRKPVSRDNRICPHCGAEIKGKDA